MKQPAVVFAYHDVGVRGLEVLLAHGVDVRLVITHKDNPQENIWFDSVAELAQRNHIPVIYPEDPNLPEVIDEISRIAPDWLFSFYYRNMLNAELLSIPKKAALNLHGSLLPDYRGRVPINWAVLHGENQCGATLHRMEEKPDAGAIIDQQAVPILPNDTAFQVFQKVVCAAETVLVRTVPQLLRGDWIETPQELEKGRYFGGRKPEDGRVDWSAGAWQIHNLVRAVAPPYPPAFFDVDGHRIHLLGSYYRNEAAIGHKLPRIHWQSNRCYADCIDGKRFQVTSLTIDQQPANEKIFKSTFGDELFLYKLNQPIGMN